MRRVMRLIMRHTEILMAADRKAIIAEEEKGVVEMFTAKEAVILITNLDNKLLPVNKNPVIWVVAEEMVAAADTWAAAEVAEEEGSCI